MRQVEVPGVGYVNYPDDWSDEQIREHATQHSQKWLAAEPAPQADPQPDKSNPTGFLPNLSAGFRSAAGPGNLSTYAAAAASAADAAGLPELRDTALQYSGQQAESAQAIPKTPVQASTLLEQSRKPDGSLSLPSLAGNTRDYLGRTIGEAAGSSLVPLGGALAGGGIGALVGGPVGAAVGALAGGGLAAQQMGAGDVYSEMAQQGTPAGQGLRAQAWGIPYGIAEMALGPEGAAAAKWAMPILRSEVLTPAVKQGVLRTALKSGAQEAVANPLQEMMVLEAAREAKGDPIESLMTMDNGWRVFDAAVGGAVGGAALGAGVGALPGRSAPVLDAGNEDPTNQPPDSQGAVGSSGLGNPPSTSQPPIKQDNVNPNPYGAANENTYTMQAGPLGTVSTADPYTQVTPPDYPQEPAFKSPVKVQMPKGQPASLTSADNNLKLARKRAEQLLKQARASKQRAKANALPAANDALPEIPSEPADTTVKAPAPAPAQKPQDTTSDTPRYSVKPFGKTGEETYGIVDNSRKPRSKGWLIQKGLPSPEVAQSFADQFNGLDNRKPTAPTSEAVVPTAQQKTPEGLGQPSDTTPIVEPPKGMEVEGQPPAPDTPEFKAWFGDSKVVTPEGKPIRLYHGTSKDKDFTKFNAGQRGIWFTEDPKAASDYAADNDARNTVSAIIGKKNTADRVIPVYLSLQNPYTTTDADFKEMNKIGSYVSAQRQLFAKLKNQGYDGVNMGGGTWVAFSPTQVKSATGNNGKFDPKNPDIKGMDTENQSTVEPLNESSKQHWQKHWQKSIATWKKTIADSEVGLQSASPPFKEIWEDMLTRAKAGLANAEAKLKKLDTAEPPLKAEPVTTPQATPTPTRKPIPLEKTKKPGYKRPDHFPGKTPSKLLDDPQQQELYNDLRERLDNAGLKDVTLNLVGTVKDPMTGMGRPFRRGEYWGKIGKSQNLDKIMVIAHDITSDFRVVSMTESEKSPVETLNHEILHALKDLGFFTDEEWKFLEDMSAKEWVGKYGIDKRYGKELNRSRLLEEGVAEAAREHYRGKGNFAPRAKTLFEKLRKLLDVLADWWHGTPQFSPRRIFDAAIERAQERSKNIEPSPNTGYMTNDQIQMEADSMPKALEAKIPDIAAASEMLLGRPRKIGPVRAGVYSNWVNKFREVIQTARGLSDVNPFFASLYGKVGLRYKTMKSMMDVYSVILHKGILNNNVSPTTKNKVFAALELWDWKKERPEINGPLTVTNDLGNLDFSKKGEEIILRSAEELNALRSVMEAADLMLDQLKHATLRNLGVQDTNLTPSEAKQKYEQLKEERNNTPRSERAGLQPEITRWKKITKELVGFDKLKKQAYLPRIRFGNAGLAVYKDNEDGEKELIHFQTIEGLDSKLKAWARGPKVLETIKALEAQYPTAQGYSVSKEAFPVTYSTIAQLIRDRARGIHNPYNALLDNIPTILTMLNQQQLDKLQDGDIREVHEYLANRLTSGSVAHHMLEAKKILGVDKEIPRVLGQYGLSMASGISKMQTAPMEREAMANIVGTNDVKLIRYATDYLNYMDNPNEEWNRLKSLGFTWNLGFNPASAALNFANIATMYGPYVSAWTTGVAPVTRSLGSAVKTAAKILKHTAGIVGDAKSFDALPNPDLALAITEDLVKKGYTSQGLYNFLSEMLKNGALDHGLSLEQIGAQPEYGSNLPEHKLGKLYQMGARKAATMFRWTEAMARLTSAISLYELMQNPQFIKNFEKSEKDKYVWQEESGGDPTKGIAGKATKENVAEYILKYTFGDYDKSNRPVFMRGIWGVINQFSQYPLMMMETMFQNMKPFSNKQDAKTLAKMLAVAFLLSGMSGFAPGSDDLKRIIEGMYKIATGGGKLNLEKEMLELMVERAGIDPGLARDIMYGPYRAVPGIENLPFVGSADISKRIALNTVPAIDNMLTMFAGNAQASPVTGPAGIVAKVSDTWDAYHRGTPYALTNMLPTAFHNVSQGMFEWADTGVRNRYNNVIIDPAADGPLALTANDYASKVIGFTPTKVTTARSMDRFERSLAEGTKDKKAHIRSQIMVAYQQQRLAAQRGDDSRYEAATQQIQDYMREIREYDADRPPTEKIGIKPKDLASIRKEALDSMGTALKTEKRTPKAKRPEVNEMRERLFGDVLPPL